MTCNQYSSWAETDPRDNAIVYTTAEVSPKSGAFKSLVYMSREIEK